MVATLLVAVPIVIVAVLGGGAAVPKQAAANLAGALRAGTVPAEYVPLVNEAGSRCTAAPPAVIAAQLAQESGWDPTAVSSAGAQGIAQFLPGTWARWAPPGSSPFDPASAIPTQGRYDCAIATQMVAWQTQSILPKSLDATSLMLAGYNAGPYAVRTSHGIPQNGQTPGYVARILSMAPAFAAPSAVAVSGSFAARFIAAARAEIGVPYAWAGGNYSGPTLGVCGPAGAEHDCQIVGLDCSGLVMYAAYAASSGRIALSHYTDTQVNSDAMKYRATVIPRGAQRPGDVIAFYEPGMAIAHHVGVYIGNGQMIDAPESGEFVRVDSLGTSYYQSQGWKVVRYS